MIIRTLAAAGMAAGLMVSAANAVTVTNMAPTKANFVYTPAGGKAHHYALAANRHINLACKNGGTLTIGKSNETCTAKTENIMLKASKGKWEFVVPQPKEI
jgi:hypothetical protein